MDLQGHTLKPIDIQYPRNFASKVRNHGLSPWFVQTITKVARGLGNNVGIRIHSAGQDRIRDVLRASKGRSTEFVKGRQERTGSVRHDVNAQGLSDTADFLFTIDGKVVPFSVTSKFYQKAFTLGAQAGFTGMGHYPTHVHFGTGTYAVWGPNGTGSTVDGRIADAYRQGRIKAGQPIKTFDPLTPHERDVLIRTIAGEAGGEGSLGKAAIAHVILNRVRDSRYPNNIVGVSKEERVAGYHQFSAWNPITKGGNSIANNIDPKSTQYSEISNIVDQVVSHRIPDPTNGAVSYYSPDGMSNGGSPKWWAEAVAESGSIQTIGGHRFAGKSNNKGVDVIGTSGNLIPDKKVVSDVQEVPASEWTVDQETAVKNGGPIPTRTVERTVTEYKPAPRVVDTQTPQQVAQSVVTSTQDNQDYSYRREAKLDGFSSDTLQRSLDALRNSQQATATLLNAPRPRSLFSVYSTQQMLNARTEGEIEVDV